MIFEPSSVNTRSSVLALRIVFSICLALVLLTGVYVFRIRKRLFDRDPEVAADHWAARNLRLWQVILVWLLAVDLFDDDALAAVDASLREGGTVLKNAFRRGHPLEPRFRAKSLPGYRVGLTGKCLFFSFSGTRFVFSASISSVAAPNDS